MPVTLEQLEKIFPNSSGKLLANFVDPLNKAIEQYEIKHPAMFIAQLGHESGGFKVLQENLNYSADGLQKVFSRYFDEHSAAQYARQPIKIANRVYANRMGNGDEGSGDGWKYRGKGAIQVTGKNNHEVFAKEMGMTIDEAVAYMQTPEGAVMSGAWFYDSRDCDIVGTDITAVTKKINGGTNGFLDRQAIYGRAIKALA